MVAYFLALKDLVLLMQENQELDSLDFSILNQDINSLMLRTKEKQMVKAISKYKPKSTTFPPLNLSPNISAFITQGTKELRDLQQSPEKNPNSDP